MIPETMFFPLCSANDPFIKVYVILITKVRKNIPKDWLSNGEISDFKTPRRRQVSFSISLQSLWDHSTYYRQPNTLVWLWLITSLAPCTGDGGQWRLRETTKRWRWHTTSKSSDTGAEFSSGFLGKGQPWITAASYTGFHYKSDLI